MNLKRKEEKHLKTIKTAATRMLNNAINNDQKKKKKSKNPLDSLYMWLSTVLKDYIKIALHLVCLFLQNDLMLKKALTTSTEKSFCHKLLTKVSDYHGWKCTISSYANKSKHNRKTKPSI